MPLLDSITALSNPHAHTMFLLDFSSQVFPEIPASADSGFCSLSMVKSKRCHPANTFGVAVNDKDSPTAGEPSQIH